MDDKLIIELYLLRDERAITETDIKYGRMCYAIARNILSSEADTEECVNDTYLGCWNAIPPTLPKSLSAFISKIARNLAMKKLRYNSAEKRTRQAEKSLTELEDILPDNRYRPDLGDEELGEILNGFLWSESEQARKVFIRKYWYFDSVDDICRKYSMSESKVKSILYRTRERLKEHLKKEGILI